MEILVQVIDDAFLLNIANATMKYKKLVRVSFVD